MNSADKNIVTLHGMTQWASPDGLMVASFLFPDQLIKRQEKLDCTVELHGWLTRGQVAVNHTPSKVPNVHVIQLLNIDAAKEALLWSVHPTWKNIRQTGDAKKK